MRKRAAEPIGGGVNDSALSLASEWRKLSRLATIVAVFTSPATFALLHYRFDWGLPWAILGAFAGIAIFRGGVDVLAHKLVPFPALYGADDELRQQDVISRRRHWYWKTKYRRATWLFIFLDDRLRDRDGGRRRMVALRRLGEARRLGRAPPRRWPRCTA